MAIVAAMVRPASAPKLLERIGHLGRNGWLAVSPDGEMRRVTYGPEALRAAREAGVDVTAA